MASAAAIWRERRAARALRLCSGKAETIVENAGVLLAGLRQPSSCAVEVEAKTVTGRAIPESSAKVGGQGDRHRGLPTVRPRTGESSAGSAGSSSVARGGIRPACFQKDFHRGVEAGVLTIAAATQKTQRRRCSASILWCVLSLS